MPEHTFSVNDKIILLKLARQTIYNYLKKENDTDINQLLLRIIHEVTGEKNIPKILLLKTGCFVTLNIDGELRGCIGTFRNDRELYKNVHDMAIQSAFYDPRFPPLTNQEFTLINIEISVLTPMTKVTNLDEIKVGEHGLYVKKGFYSGVLLPQVATEYGWDKEEFLSHTCRKAGLPMDAWKKEGIEIYKFSAIVFSEKELC
jgi:AmmeMemoRadiSam system protein A